MLTLPPRRPRPAPPSPPGADLVGRQQMSLAVARKKYPGIVDALEVEDPSHLDWIESVVVVSGPQVVESLGNLVDPEDQRVVVIQGDLFVTGAFVQSVPEKAESILAVIVQGNMSARAICMVGDAALVVTGDLVVEDAIVTGGGCGIIDVTGTVSARLALITDRTVLRARAFDGLVVASHEDATTPAPTSTDEAAARELIRGEYQTPDLMAGVSNAMRAGHAVLAG